MTTLRVTITRAATGNYPTASRVVYYGRTEGGAIVTLYSTEILVTGWTYTIQGYMSSGNEIMVESVTDPSYD